MKEMIDQIINNPEALGRLIAIAITVGVFIYIIILSILQSRQIHILQQKVQTDGDSSVRVATYVYVVVQLVLFGLALLFVIA